MKLLVFPLLMLAFTAVLSQYMIAEGFNMHGDSVGIDDQTGNFTVDDVEQEMDVEGYQVDVGFDLQTGMLAIIIIMIAVGVVAGIHVLGSGLSDFSISVIYNSVFFYSIWILLSLFGFPAINAIPIFGWLLYFFLTVLYSIGIVVQIQGGGE